MPCVVCVHCVPCVSGVRTRRGVLEGGGNREGAGVYSGERVVVCGVGGLACGRRVSVWQVLGTVPGHVSWDFGGCLAAGLLRY